MVETGGPWLTFHPPPAKDFAFSPICLATCKSVQSEFEIPSIVDDDFKNIQSVNKFGLNLC